jgi:asparagine synthase (glutamine-hydrolysing)
LDVPAASHAGDAAICGIAGIHGAPDARVVEQMTDALTHRGPDGAGLLAGSVMVLGHRRLAIMDPAGGAQPIFGEAGRRNVPVGEAPVEERAAIVANGEIYNFPGLRPSLATRHEFATRSDTEAILHLFEERDTATPAALRGMFAFAVADGDRLFLARDPIGIKPLYYGRGRVADGSTVLAFASEMAPLATWVDELHEFPPGTWFDSRTGFQRYYEVPPPEPVERSTEEHIARVRQGIEDAVASHLMSDVPVGAFLSGGLDSSLIAAIARRHISELHTFSVGVAGSPDLAAARRMADRLGTIHHEYELTADEVVATLPEIVRSLESFDQDLVRSAIPTYFCARLAARHVKVVLTGEGADELFAGYPYHRSIVDPAALQRELRRSVTTLHDINLQRCDRLTMLHGLEARVPFLDTDFIETALAVPATLKLVTEADGRVVEKWVLRKAVEDLLPDDITWRVKEQFDEGSGTVDLVGDALRQEFAAIDLDAYRAGTPDRIRSAEEAFYHRLLTRAFPRPQLILDNVARWTENRIA